MGGRGSRGGAGHPNAPCRGCVPLMAFSTQYHVGWGGNGTAHRCGAGRQMRCMHPWRAGPKVPVRGWCWCSCAGGHAAGHGVGRGHHRGENEDAATGARPRDRTHHGTDFGSDMVRGVRWPSRGRPWGWRRGMVGGVMQVGCRGAPSFLRSTRSGRAPFAEHAICPPSPAPHLFSKAVGYRFRGHVDALIPVLIQQIESAEEGHEELREACLQV